MQQMDDPPYLSVGTEVSAKYKGAFCEAKVRKVVRNIKCKVAYKQGLGSGTVSDEQIKGDVLRVGAIVEAKHPDRRELVEATITKIQDCSQYTVVFDDGDITTLRRSALCLKSGRHFNESETLDQLPLTHPEHFGNPVIGGRRGRSYRSRQMQDDSSDEEEEQESKEVQNEKEEHIGKVVCVENTDTKKKQPKENWFPALVVSPTTQENIRIRVKDEYLVRSFKDGRYYTVPKKEATEFTREMSHKQEGPAIQAALEYLDNDVLPPHWDRDSLFGIGASSSDFDQDFDSDSSDDEPREEKDHFVAQLYKYMDDRGTPLNKGPSITNRDVDLYRLFRAVHKLGGYNRVTSQNQWKSIAIRLGFTPATTSITNLVKQAYKKFLQPFEEFNRKLGCTMVAHPRANRIKGRSLVRANSVASPKPLEPKEIKHTISTLAASAAEESENNSESGAETTKSTKRKLSTGSVGKVKALVDKFEEKNDKLKVQEDVVEELVLPTTSRQKNTVKEESSNITVPPNVNTVKKEKEIKEKEKDKEKEKPKQTEKINEKRGRKKKENDNEKIEKKENETSTNTSTDQSNMPIEVGDKLRVYYHEQKVTYEAKVIEISDQNGSTLYLVHYTGWNTRYDEWVPKDRIAENITNNKTKRTKNVGKISNITTTPTSNNTTPTSSKLSAKRGRGGSRSDSQPPRSTTPSSVASNSSRTKSPATPAQRRTTRGQPSSIRRTSNNTDISSLQTESDTDSDEPVKKSCNRSQIITNKSNITPSTPISSSTNNTSNITLNHNSGSGSSQDEETFTGAKGRDYDLNQIRSELKGFKEIKSPSPESDRTPSTTQKSDAECKTELNEEKVIKRKNISLQESSSKSSSSSSSDASKTSSELSSETDSLGEDDSQSSVDKCISKKPVKSISTPMKSEKTLKTYMNYMSQDKTYPKIEETTTTTKEVLKSEKSEKKIFTSLPQDKESSIKVGDDKEKLRIDKVIEDKIDIKVEVEEDKVITNSVRIEKPITPVKIEKKPLIIEKSKLLSKGVEKLNAEKSQSSSSLISSSLSSSLSSISSTISDIYEFKEPEPFELETSTTPSKKSSNLDITEKRNKNIKSKPIEDNSGSDIKHNPPEIAKPIQAIKRKKVSPNKEPDKILKPIKKEELTPIINTPIVLQQSTLPSASILPSTAIAQVQVLQIQDECKPSIPSTSTNLPNQYKISNYDSTFDVLRKSPSFNMKSGSISNESGLSSVESQNTMTQAKPGVFVEEKVMLTDVIIPKSETKLIFEMPSQGDDVKKEINLLDAVKMETDIQNEYGKDLESVKKLMLNDNFADLEPPKIEKPSIADKVLKALNQQIVSQSPPQVPIPPSIPPPVISSTKEKETTLLPVTFTNTPPILPSSPPSIAISQTITQTKTTDIPIMTSHTEITQTFKPQEFSSSFNNKKDIETYSRKSVLSSPDILESITPKNNDLTETIQKLESAIKKTASPVQSNIQPNLDRFIDDSSDSTDSEQRLIIEDESLSSETTTPVHPHPPSNESIKTVNSPVKEDIHNFTNFSPLKFQDGIYGLSQRTILDKQQLTAVEFLTTGMIDRENERLSMLAKQQEKIQIPVPEPVTSFITNSPVKKEVDQTLHQTTTQTSLEQTAQNESISMLLCEETIPGSPAPSCGNTTINLDQPKKLYEPPFINQNTHPISSDIKPIPMEIENDLPSIKLPNVDENMKIKNPSTEINNPNGAGLVANHHTNNGGNGNGNGNGGNGGGGVTTSSSSPRDSISPDDSKSESEDKKHDVNRDNNSPVKRRRPRKSSECEASANKRRKHHIRKHGNGSDSDENNSDINIHRNPRRSPKPCQYNFLVQLDGSLSSTARISILRKKIQELRKTYNMIKAELASIDRRRKKLRRREREKNKLAKAGNS